jgi:hypothetical protein
VAPALNGRAEGLFRGSGGDTEGGGSAAAMRRHKGEFSLVFVGVEERDDT